jgi:hypothetical protein
MDQGSFALLYTAACFYEEVHMKTNYSTEELIEELTAATCRDTASAREKRAFTEALRGLVRLAKAEQMLELRTDVKKLTQLPSDTLHSHWEVD